MARLPFGPELVSIPAGSFLMGSTHEDEMADDDEKPQRKVTLRAFEIGRFPVTNAEYADFVEDTGDDAPRHWLTGCLPENLAEHPVVEVT